jgi:hypothetical protein
MNIINVGGGLIMLMVIGICLPILDPFLSLGIAATGGITAVLLMAMPFVLVVAGILYLLSDKQPAQYQPYNPGG